MIVGLQKPLDPFVWRVDTSGTWITHDIMKCYGCGRMSGPDARNFYLVYNFTWSMTFCLETCGKYRDEAFKLEEGSHECYVRYFGDLVSYSVDEGGLVETIDTKGRLCACQKFIPSRYNPEICKLCYGGIHR